MVFCGCLIQEGVQEESTFDDTGEALLKKIGKNYRCLLSKASYIRFIGKYCNISDQTSESQELLRVQDSLTCHMTAKNRIQDRGLHNSKPCPDTRKMTLFFLSLQVCTFFLNRGFLQTRHFA